MRKIKAEFTREMIDDLETNCGLDIVQELENILLDELKSSERIRKLESILIDIKK